MIAGGSVLGEKYELLSQIGEGGMGTVWHARRLDLNAEVAVKVMHADAARQGEALERFQLEARSAARLRSPHLVQILDFGVDGDSGTAYIAMELLEGESLGQRLERLGHLSASETSRWLTHVSRGLSRAHAEDIVHRDLKPENIFIVRNEDDELAKVVDFGVARVRGTGRALTTTGALIGTPHYMAPEQVEGGGEVDCQADLWSLAIIACVCLTGRRPFDSDSLPGLAMKIALGRSEIPSSLGPVPRGFDEWFARATQVDPTARFSSAAHLAESFRELISSSQVSAIITPSAQSEQALDATGISDSLDGLQADSSPPPNEGRAIGGSPSTKAFPWKGLGATALGVVLLGTAALLIRSTLLGSAPPALPKRPSAATLSQALRTAAPVPAVVAAELQLKKNVASDGPSQDAPKPAAAAKTPAKKKAEAKAKSVKRRRRRSTRRKRSKRKPNVIKGQTAAQSAAKPAPTAPATPPPKGLDATDAYDIQ